LILSRFCSGNGWQHFQCCQMLAVLDQNANHERMGTRQLRILPYTGKRAYQYYIDGLKVNGKRHDYFSKTKSPRRRSSRS